MLCFLLKMIYFKTRIYYCFVFNYVTLMSHGMINNYLKSDQIVYVFLKQHMDYRIATAVIQRDSRMLTSIFP